jgi:uncharacterized protein involved in exopolysaccharide biosynthesis
VEAKSNAQQEVVDLRELWKRLRKKKKFILLFTLTCMVLALLYIMWAKPVYEVKAMIEIGKIDARTKNEAPIDNTEDIKQKLEYIYGIKSKKKRDFPRLKSISIPKKSKSVFSLTVEGTSNQSSVKKIDEIIKKLEATYAKKTEAYIDVQNALIALTKKDIKRTQKIVDDIKNTLTDYNIKILNITKKDAALAGLYTIQISQNQARLQELESRISQLKSKVFNLQLSITPLRITQTHKIGSVEVLDKPVRPKKALIMLVAFITGLMISIFLVFFFDFMRGERLD